MLDETNSENPAENTADNTTSGSAAADPVTSAEGAPPAKKAPAKRAAAKRTTAKKTAAATTAATDAAATDTPATDAAATDTPAKKTPAKRAPAKKTAAAAAAETATDAPAGAPAEADAQAEAAPAKKATAKKTAAKRSTAKKATPADDATAASAPAEVAAEAPVESPAKKTAKKAATKKAAAKKTTKKASAAQSADSGADTGAEPATAESADDALPLFQAPEAPKARARRPRKQAEAGASEGADGAAGESAEEPTTDEAAAEATETGEPGADEAGPARRRRRRGGRRRRKPGDATGEAGEDQDASGDAESEDAEAPDEAESPAAGEDGETTGTSSRRRRRRRRTGEGAGEDGDEAPAGGGNRARRSRTGEDQITAVTGSTRLEAKKQRRREGREAGRRRAPIVSEAEFLARREAVDRVMVIRQRKDLTQIAVLEDKVLVEHYVARESQTSLIGNVYLGRVQNVLPSMEAAFIDIGKGRNAVLYAGEVNWSSLGHPDGQPRKIESVLSSGQSILVQVTKDPVGHKGARLTSQVSLAGRFLVYVPDGTTSGISRKLPDTERGRLKALLKEIVPDTAGVIVRTAAEGASEEELTRDVERLKARWEDIEAKTKGNAPQLLYGEPDLTLKVVRDLFTEDFSKLVIEGEDAWDTVQGYVAHVAPDLEQRLERYESANGKDVFAAHRIDEQIAKGLDRKVWLPSGGSLVIDRTEAMTVVDVNTGKFTGSGGNLEETVTKNNLEAAEEIVRQLRLRDIGGIIVVDFIDMVLESNRDLVVRRLVECLGRDRTRHQVAEVTSLGLVQMTRKRIGTGLLEAFSHDCDHCKGRGLIVESAPVEPRAAEDEGRRGGRRSRGGRGGAAGQNSGQSGGSSPAAPVAPSPKTVAAMARPSTEAAPEDVADDESVPEGAPVDASVERIEPIEPVEQEAAPVEPAAADSDQPESEAAVVDSEPVDPEPVAPEPVEPEKPKVVTRTRRRAASRPAGPPSVQAATEADGAPHEVSGDDVQPEVDGSAQAAAEVDQPSGVEHVPVKKKGTRKR